MVSNLNLTNWLLPLQAVSGSQFHQESLGRKNYFIMVLKGAYATEFLIDSCASLGTIGPTGGCFLEVPRGFNKWNKWAMEKEVNWKSAWLTS